MESRKLRKKWSQLSTEVMAGAGSLGAYWDRTHLVLVHVQKALTTPQVLHTARWDLPAEGLEGLTATVAETLEAWGARDAPVSLAVSSGLGFRRQVTLPLAARENLPKVVSYEIDRFLPLAADQLVFDYQIAGQTETHLTLTLMALPREFIEAWLRLCAAADLKPIAVELAPVAAANAFALLTPRPPSSWLLLRSGENDFDLLHIRDNVVRQWHSGRTESGDQLVDLAAGEVRRLSAAGAAPGALCLYGADGARLKTSTLLEQVPLPVMQESQIRVKGLDWEGSPAHQLLPALGAALRGVGRVPIKTNLLPEGDRAAVKLTGLFLTRILLILLLSLAVVWMTSIFVQNKISLIQVENQLAQLHSSVQQTEKKLAQTQALGKQLQDILKRVEQYPSTLVILRELTQIIPEHTYLYSLRVKKGQIELAGKSASAADLISVLEKSDYFTNTEFVSPIVTDDAGNEIFRIKAEIKGLGRGA
ncbi:MAG: PilN domain-containing protein [Deltaproteobacteria bacterium]|nr:PilN domain-containing protein [Deltaproteobacteria bacterium]